MSGPLMVDIAGTCLTGEDRELLLHPAVGGLILFTRNYVDVQQLATLVAQIRRVRPGLLVAADYEGGRVQRFRAGFTRIPPMRVLGMLHDDDPQDALLSARQMGVLIGMELGAVDIDLPFAPVLDLDYGQSAVIGNRALHRDAGVVARLGASFCDGLISAGMAATGKHFPGHGAVQADSHEQLPIDSRTISELQDDMEPFYELIRDNLQSLMMAHIRYPRVDAQVASLSRRWIRDYLRGTLGFAGAVFCDDLSMGGAAAVGNYLQRAQLALDAGCDMLPVCNNRQAAAQLVDQLTVSPLAARDKRLAALHRQGNAAHWDALADCGVWHSAVATALRLCDMADMELR